MRQKNETLSSYLNKRFAALDLERTSFVPHWKDLARYIQPRRGRFLLDEQNRGEKKHQAIINSKATKAYGICRAGMLSGLISPARPWFTLETANRELMERQDVKLWLRFAEVVMQRIFNQSNFYTMAPNVLGELILFGTGAMTQVDDFDDVARFYTHTIGSYWIAQNDRYEVDVFGREFQMTVRQMIQKFGYDKVSTHVRTAYDRGNYETWYPVRHFIAPNDEYDAEKKQSRFKKFRSVYFEPGNNGVQREDMVLSQAGFDDFPVHVPRWDTTNEDVYGTNCPGMETLGDVKMLQLMEKRKAQAIDKMIDPPMRGPSTLKNSRPTTMPGGLTTYDANGDHKLEPVYQVSLPLDHYARELERVERRIDEGFYVDLFQAITRMEGIQPRNELDLQKREQERLVQLGPVLQRMHADMLNPLIDRTFAQCLRARILPEPPEALQGSSLQVEYISTLALAQRSINVGAIERLTGYVGRLLQQGFEDAVYKFDAAQAVDEYAAIVGVPPRLVVPDEVAAERKQAVEEMRQQERAMQAMQAMANSAKMAGDAKLDGENMLSRMTGQ